MSLTIVARNKALDALTPATISVHSADPTASGNANIIGTAQSITYAAASNGVRSASNVPEFTIPAGTTVAWTVLKDSAGDVLNIKALANPEVYANGGTHRIASSTITLS